MRQIILFLSLFFFHLICYADKPDFMLLETYKNQNVTGWVMSEKLDGVRGYWDGKQLFTRGGITLSPPKDFLAEFPPFAIDGELFNQRNQFTEISSIVLLNKIKVGIS